MAGKHDGIRSVIPVPVLNKYLSRRLKEAVAAIEAANTTEELWKAKGYLAAVRGLQNLPEAIILDLEADDDGNRTEPVAR